MKFTFAPGTSPLAGYTIKRAIDRGGFGEVYYALSDSGKEVALKLLQRNQQVELRGVSQCLNLKHQNLVTLFDIRTDGDGDHWVVMEYMSGRSLEQVLAEHPHGLPVQEVMNWIEGLAAGVAFLHDRGVVHRDLKPANVFRENGIVKIGDIGLSKYITPSRRSAQTESVGTVYYMAPEVAHGKYGSELDVYSLGVMVYEMLTGRVPFTGESTAEILMKHLTEAPDLSPIPAPLRPVLARALEKDPLRRTPGARQLADEFKQALNGNIPAATAHPTRPDDGLRGRKGVQRAARWTDGYASPIPGRGRDSAGKVPLGLAAAVLVAVWVMTARYGGRPTMLPMFAVVAALSYGAYWFVSFFLRATRAAFAPAGGESMPARHVPVRPFAAPSTQPQVIRPVWPASTTVEPPSPLPQPVSPAPAKVAVRTVSLKSFVGDLAGSMALAAVWSVIATMGIELAASPFDGAAQRGLFALTTIIGAWLLLSASRVAEGLRLEESTRRLLLTACGGLVGVCAYWLDGTLLVQITRHQPAMESMIHSVGYHSLTTGEGQPTLAGYGLFFAALFGLRQWWRHSDPFRAKRFRISSLLLTSAVGLVVPAIFVFPQPWGVCWAGALCSVVQLSARCVPGGRRAS